jgi:hypothetical protein
MQFITSVSLLYLYASLSSHLELICDRRIQSRGLLWRLWYIMMYVCSFIEVLFKLNVSNSLAWFRLVIVSQTQSSTWLQGRCRKHCCHDDDAGWSVLRHHVIYMSNQVNCMYSPSQTCTTTIYFYISSWHDITQQ